MEFKKETTLAEILDQPCFAQMDGQFISIAMGDWFQEKRQLTLEQLQKQNPTWNCEDIIYGLIRLQEVATGGNQYVYPVRNGVRLIHLPAKEKKI